MRGWLDLRPELRLPLSETTDMLNALLRYRASTVSADEVEEERYCLEVLEALLAIHVISAKEDLAASISRVRAAVRSMRIWAMEVPPEP